MSSNDRPQSDRPAGRRRGRPPGSVSLTPEIQQTIINYVRAGAYAHVAARAAGIGTRTFFEWVARGRGEHLSRPSTPKLRAFARKVDQAQAEARLAAEVRTYREHPKYWLAHAARSRPGEDGWTDLKAKELVPFEETLEGRIKAADQAEHRSSCEDPGCGFHHLHGKGPSD